MAERPPVEDAEARKLEHEVGVLRDKMTVTVSELQRRGRELIDWRLQIKKHRLIVGLAASAFFLYVGARVAFAVWTTRRRHRPFF